MTMGRGWDEGLARSSAFEGGSTSDLPQAVCQGSLWGAMVKTWLEVAPCSLRVGEDVDHLPVTLDKIIAAEGCAVPDEFLRTGRRARRLDGTGECAGKARKRQRKETLVAKKHHPELDEAYALLMSVESAKSARPRGAT